MKSRILVVCLMSGLFVSCFGWRAYADPIFSVVIEDAGRHAVPFYDAIRSHALAAGEAWGRHFAGEATLEVLVRISPEVTFGSGRSLSAVPVSTHGGMTTYEQGAASELKTGVDPTGDAADIELTLNPSSISDLLWFDPDPLRRIADIPADRTDAMSIFLHEYGHAFGFNGWRNQATAALPPEFQSSYDALTALDGEHLFFYGRRAMAVYGGPVPLTFGGAAGNQYTHLGNPFPGPGSDLLLDLMNGASIMEGHRYGISALDLAVLADTGIPVLDPVPEPSTVLLVGAGLAAALRRRISSPGIHLS